MKIAARTNRHGLYAHGAYSYGDLRYWLRTAGVSGEGGLID